MPIFKRTVSRESDPVFVASEAANLVSPDKQNLDDAFYLATKSNFILSGGVAAWQSGLNFLISAAAYYIRGTRYTSAADDVTLAAADSTYDRIDVIYLDTAGLVGVITGTPGVNPTEPDVDDDTQVKVTFAYITANASTPNITQTQIYFENTEWTTAKDAGAAFTLASTNNPYAGTKDIEATAAKTNNYVTFTAGSNQDLSSYTVLTFKIRSKGAWGNNNYIRFAFYNSSGSRISNWVNLQSGTYSFASGTTGSYQTVSIPMSAFALTQNSVRSLRMEARGSGSGVGFYLDNVEVQQGAPTSSTLQNTFITIIADSGQTTADSSADILHVLGDGSGIATIITNDTITISGKNLSAFWNANKLQGFAVGTGAPSDASHVLGWSVSNNQWQPRLIKDETNVIFNFFGSGIFDFDSGNLDFELDISTATDFSSFVARYATTGAQTNWQYHNGASIQTFPSGGLPAAYQDPEFGCVMFTWTGASADTVYYYRWRTYDQVDFSDYRVRKMKTR